MPLNRPHHSAAWAAGQDLLIVVAILLAAIGFGVLAVRIHRWQTRAGAAELERILKDGLSLAPDHPDEPIVQVRFHTYRGFLISTTQTEHRFAAPVSRALQILDQLHRFNLRSNFRNPGAFWIPMLSWSNRRVQRKSIRRQALQKGSPA